jgi:hypothetical protein
MPTHGQAPTAPARAEEPAATLKPEGVAALVRLPVIGRIDGPTPVVVRGHVARARAAAILRQARGVHADVSRRFLTISNRRSQPVQVCVFEDARDYWAFVHEVFGEGDYSSLGFYRGDVRIAVVNLSRGVGNFRHELVHPLLGDDFPGIPTWLNEGIGALYGTANVSGRRIGFLLNYRLRDLHRAIREGTLPDFAGLTGSTGAEVHGASAAVYYAMSRYLLLYLERRGQLDRFYRDARNGPHDPASMLTRLQDLTSYDAFVAWAGKLVP